MALLGLCIPQVALGGLKQTPRVMSLPWSDVTPLEWCHTLWNCVNNPTPSSVNPIGAVSALPLEWCHCPWTCGMLGNHRKAGCSRKEDLRPGYVGLGTRGDMG